MLHKSQYWDIIFDVGWGNIRIAKKWWPNLIRISLLDFSAKLMINYWTNSDSSLKQYFCLKTFCLGHPFQVQHLFKLEFLNFHKKFMVWRWNWLHLVVGHYRSGVRVGNPWKLEIVFGVKTISKGYLPYILQWDFSRMFRETMLY